MRKSRSDSNAAAEEKRERDAINEARYRLARIARDIVSWDDQGIRTYDPAKERHDAIVLVKCVAAQLSKNEDPVVDWCATTLRAAIPCLERTQPARKRGHSADLWRERNELIIKTRKLICQKYGFTQERGNWIISQALDQLQDLRVERFGVKKLKIALDEKTINEICRRRR
jgi:hypothetical protein